jgi:MoxR-like ATPase
LFFLERKKEMKKKTGNQGAGAAEASTRGVGSAPLVDRALAARPGALPRTAASVLVYGPQGSGKTRHAEALRKAFGLVRVCGLEEPGVRPIHGTLFLSSLSRSELFAQGWTGQKPDRVVYSIDQALQLMAEADQGVTQ